MEVGDDGVAVTVALEEPAENVRRCWGVKKISMQPGYPLCYNKETLFSHIHFFLPFFTTHFSSWFVYIPGARIDLFRFYCMYISGFTLFVFCLGSKSLFMASPVAFSCQSPFSIATYFPVSFYAGLLRRYIFPFGASGQTDIEDLAATHLSHQTHRVFLRHRLFHDADNPDKTEGRVLSSQ